MSQTGQEALRMTAARVSSAVAYNAIMMATTAREEGSVKFFARLDVELMKVRMSAQSWCLCKKHQIACDEGSEVCTTSDIASSQEHVSRKTRLDGPSCGMWTAADGSCCAGPRSWEVRELS
eukprot:scaffold153375_cov19-Tisochrysis_lutea.AAC.1